MTIRAQDFYFIRHGQTDWNFKNISMGSQNIGLNNVGIEEAYKAKGMIEGIKFNTVVSSPLDRAFQTATILNEGISTEKIEIVEELREACWGVMEGKPRGDSDWLELWRKGGLIDDAETYEEFKSRVITGLYKAMDYPAPVLIVSHGGVYWVIQEMLKLDVKDLPNATPIYHKSEISISGDVKWTVEQLGLE